MGALRVWVCNKVRDFFIRHQTTECESKPQKFHNFHTSDFVENFMGIHTYSSKQHKDLSPTRLAQD